MLYQRIKAYLRNHGGPTKDKDLVDWARPWTGLGVAANLNRDSINDMMKQKHPNLTPKDSDYLGKRMGMVCKWFNSLAKSAQENYHQLAKQWTNDGPPDEVKRRYDYMPSVLPTKLTCAHQECRDQSCQGRREVL